MKFPPLARLAAALGLAAFLAACATQVAVNGRFPARFPAAAELRKLAVLGFDGRGGSDFAAVLRSELFDARFDGAPHFTIVDAGSQRAGRTGDAVGIGRSLGVQGVLFGDSSTNFSEEPFKSTRQECAYREGDKCKRYVQVDIWCRRRQVQVTANPQIVRVADGSVVYSAAKSASKETRWCQGETPRASDLQLADQARRVIVDEIRHDIAPYNAVLQATVKESADGLPKAQADQFALAVRAAKAQNVGEACRIWREIDTANPNHVWTVYNLGVCAEADGDFPGAMDFYRRSQSLGAAADRETIAAVARVNGLMSSEQQLASEQRRREEAAAAEQGRIQAAAQARAAADAAARRDAAAAQTAEAKRKQAAAAQAKAGRDARRAELVAKHGAAVADAILAGQIKVGMTREQVRASRGAPSSVETLAPGEEMWRYGATKVVFAKGRVTYVK